MESAKAIILDIDGTLTPTVSWLDFTEGLGGSVSEHSRIFDDFKNGLTTYPTAKTELIELWQATGNANRPFVTKLFESWKVFPGVEEIVSLLLENYKVCIITGSFDLWAQILAQRLGVADWYANTALIWDSNGSLVDMDYTLKQAEKKLDQMNQYCQAKGLDLTDCITVGDSDNDVKLFEASKHGVAIGDVPTELLAVAAEQLSSITDLPRLLQV